MVAAIVELSDRRSAASDALSLVPHAAKGPKRMTEPFARLPVAVLKNKALSSWARLVYPLLLSYHTEERGCFPSRDRLANDLGVSIPTIDRALNELCDAKLLNKKRQGRGHTNTYSFPDDSSPVMTQMPDKSSPATNQTDDSSPMRTPESSPMRTPESSPVMTKLDKEELEEDQQHPPTPQGEPPQPIRWGENDFTPTYIPLLGELYRKLYKAFKELDPSFTDGWLRLTLQEAEREIGPLSYDALFEGVDAALRAVRRTLEAERKGGKPIGALTPYAKRIVISTLQEQAYAVHAH